VFHGVALMHIVDYPAAIREARARAVALLRLSDRAVFPPAGSSADLLAENTPMVAPVVEIVFGNRKLILCA